MFVNASATVPHNAASASYQVNEKSMCTYDNLYTGFSLLGLVHEIWHGISILTHTSEALVVVGERKQVLSYTQMECNFHFGLKTGYKLYATITSRLTNYLPY